MKKLILVAVLAVFSCASEVLIAAAANTAYAMPGIIAAFNKKYPKIKIRLVLASSGKLTAQIIHGAPYDVFMSANMKYPDVLYKKGYAKAKPDIYAKGAIALFSIKNIDLHNFKRALLKAGLIAIANLKTAPYGRAAVEAMKNAGIYERVLNKLVYAETVTAVIPYTLNEADVGVVAKSAFFSPKMKKYKNFVDIPVSLYRPINQGIILLKKKSGAEKFYKFILSQKAKQIFKKYGYIY